jgi:hypothetical protein
MPKRKNLQCINNLEPLPKRFKINKSKKNKLKRKKSWNDIINSINSIEHNDKINKICETMKNTSFNEKSKQREIDEFYFLYFF